jgi:hypothetical protein
MPLELVALTRCFKTGAYIARKGIPVDICEAHRKLYGSGWERKFYCRHGGSAPEVKHRFSEWQGETEARFEALPLHEGMVLAPTAHDRFLDALKPDYRATPLSTSAACRR